MSANERSATDNNDNELYKNIQEPDNYVYEVLSADEKLIHETAECVSDTFTGVQVGDAYIEEPLVQALQITREMLKEFLIDYLHVIVDQGVTAIARDKQSDRVIGACVAELYDPESIATWKMKPINDVIEFCADLEQRYTRAVQYKTGTKTKKNEHVHFYFMSIRLQHDKLKVALKLSQMLEQLGKKKGCKSIFGEATNVRSELVVLMRGYKQPFDEEGKPIETVYADHPLCKTIDPKWGSACKFYVKQL